MRNNWLVGPALLGAALALAGCGSGNNPLDVQGGQAAPGTVVVGSANFSESVLIGEIYAQALEDAGAKVERKLNISTREVLIDQVASGGLSVIPEYNGNLLAFLDPDATAVRPAEVNRALADALPKGTGTLQSAEASNSNCLAVNKATAQKYRLRSINDLAPVAGELTAGGGAEFETRARGLPGLQQRYGLRFAEFRPLDAGGPLTVSALEKGDIQVASLFTTSPSLVSKGFRCLDDPENNFAAGNVTPFIHSKSVNAKQRKALNAVSGRLRTDTLIDLVTRVTEDKEDTEVVAKDWLTSTGLLK